MPYLSVVIPLYNKEKQIKQTIDSVLSQDFSDFELVIINDGSTDNSFNIVTGINDDRIRMINQPNSGVSNARNRGMAEAKGKYIVFLDADDSFMPKAFDVLKEAPDIDIIIGSFIQTDDEGNVVGYLYNKVDGLVENVYRSYWKREFYIRMGNMFIKNSFLKQQNPFRTDMTLYEDKEWILRLLDSASIYSFSKIVLNYNRGSTGLSHGFKPIEKDFANIASVKQVKNRYKKKVIGDFVFRRFISRLRCHDWKGVRRIWQNNSWNILFCMFSCVVGKYRDSIKTSAKNL